MKDHNIVPFAIDVLVCLDCDEYIAWNNITKEVEI